MISIPTSQNEGLKANLDMESLANQVQKQNVVHGTNYIVPDVSNFVVSARKSDLLRRVNNEGNSFLPSTSLSMKPNLENTHNAHNQNSYEGKMKKDSMVSAPHTQNLALKRSTREKKRSAVALEKNQVRYLVSEVPQVNRNVEFLKRWRDPNNINGTTKESAARRTLPSRSCNLGDENSGTAPLNNSQENNDNLSAFIDDGSVVWIPSERYHWEDSLSEMTAVCTSAALRRHIATMGRSSAKPFFAPLSRDYIRDRVDIDDPLNGFQIRHAIGGWLQGFVMFTTFTTWSHYFKWDSMHPSSGVQPQPGAKPFSDRYDVDGSMALELEGQPRSGDPLAGGVVFSSVAEISLLGGLGCGEYLLRMALDDIIAKGHYNYVVLQATNTSIAFYERFGFIRVGAVSRYGGEKITKRIIRNPGAVTLSDIIGYRHWTYAHESERSLGKHGGPSYMMALRLPERSDEANTSNIPSFLEVMKKNAVTAKPMIAAVGGNVTPAGKRSTIDQCSAPFMLPSLTPTPQQGVIVQKRSSRTSQEKNKAVTLASPMPSMTIFEQSSEVSKPRKSMPDMAVTKKAVPSVDRTKERIQMPNHRRERTSLPDVATDLLLVQRGVLLAPPPEGQTLSYNQKQYQSPWLAVPPAVSAPASRPPPKSRALSDIAISTKKRKRSGETSASKSLAAAGMLAVKSVATSVAASVAKRRSQNVVIEEEKKMQVLDFADPNAGPPSTKLKFRVNSAKKDSRFFSFRKQRIMSMPKHIPKPQQFFNKVVKQKGSTEKKYWFVLHYDHEQGFMRVIPLDAQGLLAGKRNGRPRWKALVEFSDVNVQTVQPAKYEIVPAFMVTKTPMVELETWDIFD